MHDIKYFFLNKNNQTIQGGKKIFQGGKLPKVLPKKYYFLKFRGGHMPLLDHIGSAPNEKC
jgi:hypothetical protein